MIKISHLHGNGVSFSTEQLELMTPRPHLQASLNSSSRKERKYSLFQGR